MTTEKKWYKHPIATTIFTVILGVVSSILAAIIISEFKIGQLEYKIQEQNTVIHKLENNIISFESTIQEQNITIQKLENNVVVFENTFQEQNITIQKLEKDIATLENTIQEQLVEALVNGLSREQQDRLRSDHERFRQDTWEIFERDSIKNIR